MPGKPGTFAMVRANLFEYRMLSGIVNDANDWAVETMGNPRYPLELFQRVVTVSLETQRVVKGLRRLEL